MTKKMVDRDSENFTIAYGLGKLGDLKKFIDALDLPDDAKLCVTEDYDGYPDSIYFEYQSLETDEEYEGRLKKEYYEKKRIQDDEIAMYKILKKKFEGENK